MEIMEDREYDNWWDKEFKRLTRGREDHEFNHFNTSMGIQIYGKEHYKYEMKKRRMVSIDAMEDMAQEYDKAHPHQGYGDLSPKAMDVIRSIKQTADKNGNVKLGGVAINALIELGVIQSQRDNMPTSLTGGFS